MKLGWLIFAIITLVLCIWTARDVNKKVERIAVAFEQINLNYDDECEVRGFKIIGRE